MMEREAKCLAYVARILSVFVINVFAYKCADNILKNLKATKEVKLGIHSCLKFWYIFAMTYFITILAIQVVLGYMILFQDKNNLLVTFGPLAAVATSGLLYLHYAFIAYLKTYQEIDVIKNYMRDSVQIPIVNNRPDGKIEGPIEIIIPKTNNG